MTNDQIAAVIHRHAQAHKVDAATLLARQLPQDSMMRYVAARRAAMAELHALGTPICKIARIFRITWPTVWHHIKKYNHHVTQTACICNPVALIDAHANR